jgi:peptide-methionine (R)-S-oxide reductase
MVKIVEFSDTGQRQDTVTVPMIVKPMLSGSDGCLRQLMTSLGRDGTERAYTGAYWNLHDKGLYHCICCDTPLFSSETKFDSGTGWRSFWQPAAKENVHESLDISLEMQRTAVGCRSCEAHFGHVFDDGPEPTGLRYCMNSVALKVAKLA